jgi:hypothetical protein
MRLRSHPKTGFTTTTIDVFPLVIFRRRKGVLVQVVTGYARIAII